jgi:hypothetical protein
VVTDYQKNLQENAKHYRVVGYSRKIYAHNTVGAKEIFSDTEDTKNSNYCAYVIERTKSHKENGKSPLLALIDLKSEGIFHTKVNYVDTWEAMVKAGMFQDKKRIFINLL